MGRIIFLLASMLFCGAVFSQGVKLKTSLVGFESAEYVPIAGYTKIFARYEWIAGAFDSGLHVPQYNGVPSGVRTRVWQADGAVAVDTNNHRLYFYSGGNWLYSTASTGGGTPTWQQTLTAGSTLTGNNTIVGGDFIFSFTASDFVVNGTFGAGATIQNSTAARMYFNPKKAAFRAGSANGTQWNDANVGAYSSAFGVNTVASGVSSKSWGELSTASADYSTAWGVSTVASGDYSTAFGNGNTASGSQSTTWGDSNFATETISTAWGDASYASGIASTSAGYGVKSKSYSGFVVGTYNDSTNATSSTVYNTANRAFQIGIGTADNDRRNAITVLFSGSVGIGTSTPDSLLHNGGSFHNVGNGRFDQYIDLADISAPATPASGFGRMYTRTDSLRYKNDAGTEFTMGLGGGGTPGGSDNEFQYNNGGAFGGTTGIEYYGAANMVLRSQAQAAGDVALIGKAHASQSANIFEVQNSSGTSIGHFTSAGRLAYTDFVTAIGTDVQSGNVLGTGYNVLGASTSFGVKFRGNDASLPFEWFFGATGRAVVTAARVLEYQGTDVASAAGAIAASYGNTFEITGTSAITLISNVNWQNGSVIYLIFTSTAVLTDGTANSGTDIGMELAGGANFTGSADDIVTLLLCEMGGTQRWREISRSVN